MGFYELLGNSLSQIRNFWASNLAKNLFWPIIDNYRQLLLELSWPAITKIFAWRYGNPFASISLFSHPSLQIHLWILLQESCFAETSSALVDAVVYLVDAYDKERFAESKKELDALLSNESLATVPFLILGNKIDIPYTASDDELRYLLGLDGINTGRGKVNLSDSNVHPIEVLRLK